MTTYQHYEYPDSAYSTPAPERAGIDQVNDSYGHNVGDGLLKTTARPLAEGLRPGDIVGRWGGEEFLVLMPDVNAIALGDLAERCQILIAGSEIKEEDHRISVTASIGATALNAEETSEIGNSPR